GDEAAGLIRQLADDAALATRLAAIRRLAQARQTDPAAEPLLVREFLKPDLGPMARSRVSDLLTLMGDADTPELRRLTRAATLLETAGTPDARQVLGQLASLPANRGGAAAAAALNRLDTGKTAKAAALLPPGPGSAGTTGVTTTTTRP